MGWAQQEQAVTTSHACACSHQAMQDSVERCWCCPCMQWDSPNGTTEARGQFLEIYIRSGAAHARAATPHPSL